MTVATVDFPPPRVIRCSIATLGGSYAAMQMSNAPSSAKEDPHEKPEIVKKTISAG